MFTFVYHAAPTYSISPRSSIFPPDSLNPTNPQGDLELIISHPISPRCQDFVQNVLLFSTSKHNSLFLCLYFGKSAKFYVIAEALAVLMMPFAFII